jgi:hypothetical protein
MIVGDISGIFSTKYTSCKIVSKISNSWELNVSYLATLCGAVIIIGHSSVKLQQISGVILYPLGRSKHGNT